MEWKTISFRAHTTNRGSAPVILCAMKTECRRRCCRAVVGSHQHYFCRSAIFPVREISFLRKREFSVSILYGFTWNSTIGINKIIHSDEHSHAHIHTLRESNTETRAHTNKTIATVSNVCNVWNRVVRTDLRIFFFFSCCYRLKSGGCMRLKTFTSVNFGECTLQQLVSMCVCVCTACMCARLWENCA